MDHQDTVLSGVQVLSDVPHAQKLGHLIWGHDEDDFPCCRQTNPSYKDADHQLHVRACSHLSLTVLIRASQSAATSSTTKNPLFLRSNA